MNTNHTHPEVDKNVASQIIILKCIVSGSKVMYIEIDTGQRSWELNAPEMNSCGLSLQLLAPKAVLYELDVALRFANSPEEAMEALKTYGFPQKLEVSVYRVESVAQRITIDLFPHTDAVAQPLPEKKKRVIAKHPAEMAAG